MSESERRLSYSDVSALLEANFETGKLFWKARTPDMFFDGKQNAEHSCNNWNSRFAGKEAFKTDDGRGYRAGCLNNRVHKAHRVLWLLATGGWPDHIDHINGICDDNRLVNLRSVSNAENSRNRKRISTNSSGVTGVYWDKRGVWVSKIRLNGAQKHLGYSDDFLEAWETRILAEIEYGYHPNHGRSA